MTTDPPRLVPLDDGWMLWPCFETRGAGFALERLKELHSPATVKAAQSVDLATRDATEQRARVMAMLAQRRESNRIFARVRRMERGVSVGDPIVDGALRELDRRRDALAAAEAALATTFSAGQRAADEALRATLSSFDFRRAILLQNRAALHGGMDAWSRAASDADDHGARRARVAVATYLQRYATKNDTVGFFGPVGWGAFSDDQQAVTQAPGPALVEHVAVHLEPWAVAAVADAAAEKMRTDLVPELSPRMRVVGDEIHGMAARSIRGTRPLPSGWAAVLPLVDGKTTLGTLEADEARARSVHAMITQGLLRVRLPVTADAIPHRALLGVDALEAARLAVETSFHGEAALDSAIRHLDDEFARITGAAVTRNAGQTYGSRTLFYANCRRHHSLRLGRIVHDTLRGPLTLLLHAARWFTYEVSRAFLRELRAIHHGLTQRLGTDRVPMVHVNNRLIPLSKTPPATFIADVTARLEERWADVLGIEDSSVAVVQRTTAGLRPRVAAAFAAPHPGHPFRDAWFDDKVKFARLWSMRAELPADEGDAVEEHVPPTFVLDAGLALRSKDERERWVLKPAAGFGGFGVVVGTEVSQAQWEVALQEALTRRTVLQARVDIPRLDVARVEDGGIAWKSQYVTVSFWCHHGAFSGGFARAGTRALVNVHQGGGIGPLIFA